MPNIARHRRASRRPRIAVPSSLALLLARSLAAATPAEPAPAAAAPAAGDVSLDRLEPGRTTHGFTATAVYLDARDQPIGARLTHDKTGFTLDYLRIESAPQGFIWVTTFPTSEKGEPHTQEHLLLGKGDRGRRLGSFEAMALAQSSAFTEQWRTCYHFHTVAGHDVFWAVFEDQLDALLNPDYTDEEIRREVRNFGVDRAGDGTLRLEEKGTVYNEMVRTYESPDAGLWHAAGQLVYGPDHPLALDSGGFPPAIRTMTAEDIRRFHAATYHLANMGMVGAFPATMPLAAVLDRTGELLERKAGRAGKVRRMSDLPRPAPPETATPVAVEYPAGDATSPSPMLLAWPATRDLDLAERTLLDLFLDAFSGDESTTLYKKLIDGTSRAIDLGASGVGAYHSGDPGEPVFITVNGVRADRLDDATLGRVRELVMAELARLAGLPDGDAELVAFNRRVGSRVTDLKRRLAKFLDTPPGFGFRGTGPAWINHLHQLERSAGFRKSLTLSPELARVEAVLGGPVNPWRERLGRWGLAARPFALVARPSPARRAALNAERGQRIDDELARLAREYGTPDRTATLARYQTDYDAATRKLEEAARAAALPPLVASPPMTQDDDLVFDTEPVSGVPAFHARLGSMQSVRVALALRADTVPEDDLMFLALLPRLMSEAGVFEDGKAIASDEVRERLRKEVLELSVRYAEDLRTGRIELVVAGAGIDVAEARLALGWMGRVLDSPDWRIENLPRLRDLVDQSLTDLRQTTQGAEEGWVYGPRDAWWRQEWPVHLHTSSFLTRAHDLHRLRWMLLDPRDAGTSAEASAFLESLAAAGTQPRAVLAGLAAALAGGEAKAPEAAARWTAAAASLGKEARAIAAAAGKDLVSLLPELPDGSLAADWSYLCKQMASDLKRGAPQAIAGLARAREAIVAAANARLVVAASPANQQAIAPAVAALAGRLDRRPRSRQSYPARRPIAERLREHEPGAGEPRYVGLVAPSTSSGVIMNSAPSTTLADASDAAVLDYLAGNTYAGHGAHGLFIKTWAAGLAYSNGIRPSILRGRIDYYAERCPLLPQTLRFVIDQLKQARIDASIARYAVATAFDSRIAQDYERRATAMASDLADGVTPELVRAFRGRVLAIAEQTDLAAKLQERMPAVYGKVLPGYGPPADGGVYFVIGPDSQLDAYQDYLRQVLGKDATLHRLYPRDFWIPAKP